MKEVIYSVLLIILNVTSIIAQEPKTPTPFYKISLATTFTNNEDYTFNTDDDSGPFLLPNAFIINNTLGYKLDNRSFVGINIGYNHHFEYSLNFVPAYLSFQYNIFDFEDAFFLRAGYGKLLKLGKIFERGSLYTVGLGFQIYDQNYKNSFHLGLDFSRKRFGIKQKDKLSSVSLFLEYMIN